MKLLLILLLLTGCVCAQSLKKSIRRDSLPEVFPPDMDSPRVDSPDLMPTARTNNSFYRHRMDPPNVVRATLDNMPVKIPDSSTYYTMLRSYQKWRRLNEPPMRFLKPMPPVLPRKP